MYRDYFALQDTGRLYHFGSVMLFDPATGQHTFPVVEPNEVIINASFVSMVDGQFATFLIDEDGFDWVISNMETREFVNQRLDLSTHEREAFPGRWRRDYFPGFRLGHEDRLRELAANLERDSDVIGNVVGFSELSQSRLFFTSTGNVYIVDETDFNNPRLAQIPNFNLFTVSTLGQATSVRITSVGTGRRITMHVGRQREMRANVMPAGAAIRNIVWSTSDPEVVSIDGNGRIEAVSEGFATITATSVDGGHTDSVEVRVHMLPALTQDERNVIASAMELFEWLEQGGNVHSARNFNDFHTHYNNSFHGYLTNLNTWRHQFESDQILIDVGSLWLNMTMMAIKLAKGDVNSVASALDFGENLAFELSKPNFDNDMAYSEFVFAQAMFGHNNNRLADLRRMHDRMRGEVLGITYGDEGLDRIRSRRQYDIAVQYINAYFGMLNSLAAARFGADYFGEYAELSQVERRLRVIGGMAWGMFRGIFASTAHVIDFFEMWGSIIFLGDEWDPTESTDFNRQVNLFFDTLERTREESNCPHFSTWIDNQMRIRAELTRALLGLPRRQDMDGGGGIMS